MEDYFDDERFGVSPKMRLPAPKIKARSHTYTLNGRIKTDAKNGSMEIRKSPAIKRE
jgi:hypothetical protein